MNGVARLLCEEAEIFSEGQRGSKLKFNCGPNENFSVAGV